ncbi:DUF1810 domain-containing protein [Pseudovibrio sp. Tun.PSC04-5.I4]|uniref:DUF1810 domain-containing protein n=1 Tax=Pseudovibrio sp. Tun.PSC04-5.I4 TaxID=1798213 RepID=UPI000881BA11|nr:DUF1810 domain-containing protein [Pseudovibrio sp. Tun.PSC04-5.I4]SDQ83426.1 Uncharacterized protein, DUF1810 family [Pseudovibrio sp. Tun.PSC04-5.I4]
MVRAMRDDLTRFVIAQDPVYGEVVRELSNGKKTSHWIWFIFPQLRRLGRSSTAHFYGIEDLSEAQTYLSNPMLTTRLRGCCELLLNQRALTSRQILGEIDSMKVRSSMTLFALAADDPTIFLRALTQFYDGMPCSQTMNALDMGWPFKAFH